MGFAICGCKRAASEDATLADPPSCQPRRNNVVGKRISDHVPPKW